METVTKLQKKSRKRGFRYWLRVLHRDIGYLAVGLCIVYGISGILLNHLGQNDPAFKKEEKTIQITAQLSEESITKHWNAKADVPKLNKVLQIDEEHLQLFLNGGIGVYNQTDGKVTYETHKKRLFVYWINRLHYNNVGGWTFMADVFAGVLIFLAISGLFILKGKKGFAGRGKWLLLIGILIPILYIVFQ